MFDTLIRGGTVIDGTGRPAFAADVAISGGRIAAIGDLPATSAAHVIDAVGRTVTPGFIDIHRHADAALFRPGFGAAELCQGLTTIVNGNCGLSAAPFGPAHGDAIRDYLRPITGALPPDLVTETLSGYFASVPNIPVHVGMLAGAGVLRADAAGYELEHLEDRHYRALHRALEQALADGALGFARVARAGGDHLHAFLHHDLCKFICLRMHQHDVHTERLVGQLLAAADVLAQGIGIHAAGPNDAQRTCVGAGGGKFAGGNVGHAALNDGVFCAQNFVQKFHSLSFILKY